MTAVLSLAVDVEQLTVRGGLLDQLETLVGTPDARMVDDAGPIARGRVSGSPAPWHNAAGMAVMAIHAGARELEQDVRYRISGHVRDLRGGSDENTRAALAAIVELAYGLDEHGQRAAGRQVAGWVRIALEALGEQERWTGLPRQPGQYPPGCPYCGTFSLRILRSALDVRCVNPECRDTRGHQPYGRAEPAERTRQGYDAVRFDDGAEVWWLNEDQDDEDDNGDQAAAVGGENGENE